MLFGPTTVFVEVADQAQLSAALHGLHGQLTATIIGEPADLQQFAELTPLLEQKVGRILLNGYPTGVEVCDSMVHGGPYPATSDARGTSVASACFRASIALPSTPLAARIATLRVLILPGNRLA